LIFHETKFNKILSETFNSILSYFLAYRNGLLIGVCPCQTFKDKFILHTYSNLSSFEIPYGGWVYNSRETTINTLLNKTWIPCNEILYYTSGISINNNEYFNLNNFNKYEHKTVILDLAPSLEELYGVLMKSKQRNKIERARKLGITVSAISYNNIVEFVKLSSELKDEIGLPKRTNQLYQGIMEAYSANGKAICLAAFHGGVAVSSMILLANRNFTIAWVAGRKTGLPNNLYQNELLWWESIVWAKNFGSRYLDLCGLDEISLPQLARIKLSFSKMIVPFYSLTKKSLMLKVLSRLSKNYKKVFNN